MKKYTNKIALLLVICICIAVVNPFNVLAQNQSLTFADYPGSSGVGDGDSYPAVGEEVLLCVPEVSYDDTQTSISY